MKYARIAVDGATRWGIVRGHKLQLIDGSPYDGGQITETLHKLADVRLLAPVTPSKIFCLGRNYQDHRVEMGYEHVEGLYDEQADRDAHVRLARLIADHDEQGARALAERLMSPKE